MASPPEVHSALLTSGPGPGATIAAALAWSSLAAEYASAASELADVLATVQAEAWQGSTAEEYVAAHGPYLAWLMQSSEDSFTTAAQLDATAASYAAAVATMPTLPELAANHATHAALLATNFFGINTIPIMLNEADYVRMWVQAAVTMSTYQVASTTALSGTPRSTAAPQIVKAAASEPPTDPNDPFGLGSLLQQLEQFEGGNSLLDLIWPGNPFTSYPPGTDFATALADVWQSFTDGLFVYDPQTLAFAHNPIQLIAVLALAGTQLITHRIFDLLQLVYNFPQLLVAVVPLVTSSVGAASGLSGLAALAGIAQPVPAPTPPMPDDIHPQPITATAPASAPVMAPAAPPASPASANVAPAPNVPPPSPGTGAEAFGFPYLIEGGPGGGFGSGMRTQTGATSRSSDAEKAATAAAAAAQNPSGRRRRDRARQRQLARGFEYMDLNPSDGDEHHPPSAEMTDPSVAVSDCPTQTFGFTGAARREGTSKAIGLTTLADDKFGGKQQMPLLPDTWADQQGSADNTR